jgi:glycosyltransferase involved in cell wall biosynthesis
MTVRHGLRLLMSVDTVGGVWTYAVDLAAGLAARGVATVLAVLGPPPDAAQRADAAGIPGLQLVVLDQPLEWLAGSASEVEASGAALAALARETGADLVHLNSPAPAAATRLEVPLVIACHSCLATWWESLRDEPLPEDFRWRAELAARGYRSADLLVAPTAWFAGATRAAYDLPRTPLIVHNGRRSGAANGQAVASPPVAFAAGRLWDEGKGARTLDSVAALLPFPLLAAGPVTGPNGVTVDLRHLQLAGRLSAAGISAVLAAQPIFVSAARYEPFGLAVLEAAQSGCALVLSDTSGFRELWDGAAVFVAADDAGGFAMAIGMLADDPERRAALGVAARERAGHYSLERQVDGMLTAYRELLCRTGRDEAA